MEARLPNWSNRTTGESSSTASAGPRDPRESAAQALEEIREAAEHIRASGVTLEDARADAARVIELCNHLAQLPAAPAGRAARSQSDRRQGERRSAPGEGSPIPSSTEPASPTTHALVDPRLRALSKRELQVFKLLAEGLTAAEIASRLSRSAKTIHNHRTRILQKLGLRNATELVRLALRCGLVSI